MNIEGATLKLLLYEEDKDKALAVYAELNPNYFSNTFKAVLRHIRDFYNDRGYIPSYNEIEIFRSRDRKTLAALAAINLIDTQGVDIDLVVEELANQHAQNTVLDLFDGLLQEISMLSRHELLERLSSIPLKLEESITDSNIVYSAANLPVFTRPEELSKAKMFCGICNEWDIEAGGYYRQEFVLLGGKRGSGKSVFCANLAVQQHYQGNVSVYFTIEMEAKETYSRIICILSGVKFSRLKKGELTEKDRYDLAKAQASLFHGGDKVLDKYFNAPSQVPDVFKFQEELQKTCKEKDEGRIIIIDDKDLSMSTIDVKLTSLKSRYGDKLTLACVDYINQVILEPGVDPYDWKVQTTLGKLLKNQARKNDVCLVSPYQMDDTGGTRFAKGILDAADLAQLIKIVDKDSGVVALETTKARSTKDNGIYGIRVNWDNLTIDPEAIDLNALKNSEEEIYIPEPKESGRDI